jgi:hypothetical protein
LPQKSARTTKAKGIQVAGKLFLREYGIVKTTLEIPDPLFRWVKAYATMKDLKFKDVVASALSAYLVRPRRSASCGTHRCPFPLIRGKLGPLMKEMSTETIAKLQEREDFERLCRSLGC